MISLDEVDFLQSKGKGKLEASPLMNQAINFYD